MKKEMHHRVWPIFYFFEHLTKKHYLVNINVDSDVVW